MISKLADDRVLPFVEAERRHGAGFDQLLRGCPSATINDSSGVSGVTERPRYRPRPGNPVAKLDHTLRPRLMPAPDRQDGRQRFCDGAQSTLPLNSALRLGNEEKRRGIRRIDGLGGAGQFYLSRDGKILADIAWGKAPGGTPYAPDTLVSWASAVKPTTATCLMKLRERGKIDLDDKVTKNIFEFGEFGKADVRIRLGAGRRQVSAGRRRHRPDARAGALLRNDAESRGVERQAAAVDANRRSDDHAETRSRVHGVLGIGLQRSQFPER